jgi:hypothetical protein
MIVREREREMSCSANEEKPESVMRYGVEVVGYRNPKR